MLRLKILFLVSLLCPFLLFCDDSKSGNPVSEFNETATASVSFLIQDDSVSKSTLVIEEILITSVDIVVTDSNGVTTSSTWNKGDTDLILNLAGGTYDFRIIDHGKRENGEEYESSHNFSYTFVVGCSYVVTLQVGLDFEYLINDGKSVVTYDLRNLSELPEGITNIGADSLFFAPDGVQLKPSNILDYYPRLSLKVPQSGSFKMSFTLKGNFDSENSNISIALFDESNGVKIMSISDPYVNMIGVSIDSTLLMAERPHGYANAGIGLPVGSSIPGVVLHKDDVEFVFMLYYNNTTRKFSASYLKDGLEVPIGSVDSPFPDGVPEKIDVTGMEWYGTTYRNYCTVAQISVESGF